jgi:glycosyltransferase involved in cell wall biosynthesis
MIRCVPSVSSEDHAGDLDTNGDALVSCDLKICIASSGLGHVARGIETWAADLGLALRQRGVNVVLCKGGGSSPSASEHVLSCWQRESKKTQRLLRWLPRRLFWRFGLGGAYDIEQTTFAWRLVKYLRKEKVDLLHVQDPGVAIWVQKARRLGLVHTRTILAHGTEEPPEFLQRIDYLQHLAPWHLEDTRVAGVGKPAWTAIPNFIDTELFRPGRCDSLREELGIPAEAIVVLCVAAIKRHHKRIDYLLSECSRICPHPSPLPEGKGTPMKKFFGEDTGTRPPVWLLVAGGWEKETDELVSEGRRLLGDRVRFLVRFPRERMPELYRAADLFVLCSLKEMMPIALLEAAASGLPCLVHQHPIMQWMVGPGGEAIDMEQPGSLAAALARLASDHERRVRLGVQAREHCVENFSRDRVVDQILEYYDFVMRDGQPGTEGLVAPYNCASPATASTEAVRA